MLPLLQRLYAARGVTDAAQAQPKLAQLHAPDLLGSMQAAVTLLADAIARDAFPSKALAGVGVIFYVLMALRRHLREQGAYATVPEPDLLTLLDLVAVGTVADLVALDDNNRALVSAGLRRLRSGKGCVGLQALIEASGRDASRLTGSDIGFALGPRLNAAGRLEDMALGIELLLTEDRAHAREIATTLESINTERRAVQQLMTDDAELAVSRAVLSAEGVRPVAACLFDAEWHRVRALRTRRRLAAWLGALDPRLPYP